MENKGYNNELTFLEKIILLALDDKGWFGSSENSIKFGLAGAILFELYKHERIIFKEGVVVVNDNTPINEPLFDRVLESIATIKKNKSIRRWIQRMVYKKMMIRKSIIKSLITKRIIRKEEYSIFWVMYQFKYPLVNSEVKTKIKEELFNKIIHEEKLNGWDLMMLSILDSCRAIRKNFKSFSNYPKFRRKVKELMQLENYEIEDLKIVGNINTALKRAIAASNVSIHA